MAIPTAAEFKARHARFAAVVDATVDLYIAEASRTVSDAWATSDYADGIMYLAAHLMVEEGALDPTGAAPGTMGQIKKVKAGDVETEFAVGSGTGAASAEAYASTVYGRRYYELAARNTGFAGAVVLVV